MDWARPFRLPVNIGIERARALRLGLDRGRTPHGVKFVEHPALIQDIVPGHPRLLRRLRLIHSHFRRHTRHGPETEVGLVKEVTKEALHTAKGSHAHTELLLLVIHPLTDGIERPTEPVLCFLPAKADSLKLALKISLRVDLFKGPEPLRSPGRAKHSPAEKLVVKGKGLAILFRLGRVPEKVQVTLDTLIEPLPEQALIGFG
jgi:hypothetical protein